MGLGVAGGSQLDGVEAEAGASLVGDGLAESGDFGGGEAGVADGVRLIVVFETGDVITRAAHGSCGLGGLGACADHEDHITG